MDPTAIINNVVEKKKKEELGNQTWIGCTVSKHASH
jgi:hypothetical protein